RNIIDCHQQITDFLAKVFEVESSLNLDLSLFTTKSLCDIIGIDLRVVHLDFDFNSWLSLRTNCSTRERSRRCRSSLLRVWIVVDNIDLLLDWGISSTSSNASCWSTAHTRAPTCDLQVIKVGLIVTDATIHVSCPTIIKPLA